MATAAGVSVRDARRFDMAFRATAGNVAPARARLMAWLRPSLAAGDELLDDVALAVSEACTNAVIHAHRAGHGRPDEGTFRVSASYAGERVRVTVSDDGGGLVARTDSPGQGCGLPLIAALSDTLSIGPATEGDGTVVRMEFIVGRTHRPTRLVPVAVPQTLVRRSGHRLA
jgi:serine/threonine-protein kinase RsbW